MIGDWCVIKRGFLVTHQSPITKPTPTSIAPRFSAAAAITFCTADSTASLVSVVAAERKTSVTVTLFLPRSSGFPR